MTGPLDRVGFLRPLAPFLIAMPLGLLFAQLAPGTVQDAIAVGLTPVAGLLLAVGLYGSTYQIDLTQVRQDLGLIGFVITVGVALKAVIVGLLMYLLIRDDIAFFLGLIMAQIDPLSIARVSGSGLSPRARRLLLAWSSLDDPITTVSTILLLAIYVNAGFIGDSEEVASLHVEWPQMTAISVGLVVAAAVIWRLTRTRFWLSMVALVPILLIGAYFYSMLAIAVIGLFYRPQRAANHLHQAVGIAYWSSVFIVGILLIDGIYIAGVVLGIATWGAQVFVGFAASQRFTWADRIRLALSQMNGITSVILALALQPVYPDVVRYVVPAIITINLLYIASDTLVQRRLPRPSRTADH